jgi:hypothetical protein
MMILQLITEDTAKELGWKVNGDKGGLYLKGSLLKWFRGCLESALEGVGPPRRIWLL